MVQERNQKMSKWVKQGCTRDIKIEQSRKLRVYWEGMVEQVERKLHEERAALQTPCLCGGTNRSKMVNHLTLLPTTERVEETR